MIKLNKKNVFVTEVADKFALVDRDGSQIYIVDATNAEKFNAGESFEVISTETAMIQASTSNSNPGGNAGGGSGEGNFGSFGASGDGFEGFDGFSSLD